jgi:ferritin-like metal-binding protein YciE
MWSAGNHEMAGYGTVSAFAEELGESKHVSLLNQTLEEEKQMDEKLTKLPGDIKFKANRPRKRNSLARRNRGRRRRLFCEPDAGE